jgi:hypothetical protein
MTRLNAVGKPYSPSYDPNYRLKYKPSNSRRLYWPYPTAMRFVDDPSTYDPNLRCFRGDPWWTALMARAEEREARRRKPKSSSKEENTAAMLSWKENTRNSELTARAPAGGSYILGPFLGCWNVDYCEKKGRGRRQLGFTNTLDEAKALAQAHAEGAP